MSLSRRITVRLTATMVAAAGVAYGWLHVKQSHVESYLRQRALAEQAQEISGFVSLGKHGSIELVLPPELLEAYTSPRSRYTYAVRDEAGQVVASSGRRVGPLPQFIESSKHQAYTYPCDGTNSDTNGVAVRSVIGDRSFVTQVEQIAPMSESLNAAVFDEFFEDGGWLVVPFLLALVAIGLYTVRTALAPLGELSRCAARIDPGNSDVRLPDVGVPKEMLPVVRSINGALDRLDNGLRRQREFNANAAHQLRTPLAVLSANIEAMRDQRSAAKLRYDVDLMSRIVNQLLLVARLETFNVPLDEQVDLCAAAREVAENLGGVAVASRKMLEVEEPGEPILVRGNRSAIAVGISNLVENALNHISAEGVVRIRVTATPSVEVCDSGPGIPLAMREKIFERFWRGENSKAGAGLGLAIVRKIMSALGGSVSVTDAPEGGAQFTLVFPAFAASDIPTTACRAAQLTVGRPGFSNAMR
jgi:signal transduction histidine kinase